MIAIYSWIPALSWMVLIFVLSSRPSVHVTDTQVLNFLFFKSLHVIEYFILYILTVHALRISLPKRGVDIMYRWAAVVVLWYAASDEIHQLFVPTREGRIRDVIIDCIGIILAWFFLTQLLPKAPMKLKRLAKRLHLS